MEICTIHIYRSTETYIISIIQLYLLIVNTIITINSINRYMPIITTFIYLSINTYLRIIYGNTIPTTIILH